MLTGWRNAGAPRWHGGSEKTGNREIAKIEKHAAGLLALSIVRAWECRRLSR